MTILSFGRPILRHPAEYLTNRQEQILNRIEPRKRRPINFRFTRILPVTPIPKALKRQAPGTAFDRRGRNVWNSISVQTQSRIFHYSARHVHHKSGFKASVENDSSPASEGMGEFCVRFDAFRTSSAPYYLVEMLAPRPLFPSRVSIAIQNKAAAALFGGEAPQCEQSIWYKRRIHFVGV